MLSCSLVVVQAVSDLRAVGKTDKEIERFSVLFKEVQQQIDAKQLRPFIRTQYMRTAFQVRTCGGTSTCWPIDPGLLPACPGALSPYTVPSP